MRKEWISHCYTPEEQAAMNEVRRCADKTWLAVTLRAPDMESFRDFDIAARNVARIFGAEESAISVTRAGVRFDEIKPKRI